MSEDGSSLPGLPQAFNDSTGALRDIPRCLTIWQRATPDSPTRVALAHLILSESSAIAVIPFLQVRFDLRRTQVARYFTRPYCPLQRTANYTVQQSSDLQCFVLASRSEGQIAPSAVLTSNRPLRFAVTDQQHFPRFEHELKW
jgi:hypothetical protein